MSTSLTEIERLQEAERVRKDREWVIRTVTCALDRLSTLDDAWFVYDAAEMSYAAVVHDGEELLFAKTSHSKIKPPMLAFSLKVPQSAGRKVELSLWIQNPQQDTAVNRRATRGALERLLTGTARGQHSQVDATNYQ